MYSIFTYNVYIYTIIPYNIIINKLDEALVLHQAQPPKIPSLLRLQASAAARSSSFLIALQPYLAGIVWPRALEEKNSYASG